MSDWFSDTPPPSSDVPDEGGDEPYLEQDDYFYQRDLDSFGLGDSPAAPRTQQGGSQQPQEGGIGWFGGFSSASSSGAPAASEGTYRDPTDSEIERRAWYDSLPPEVQATTRDPRLDERDRRAEWEARQANPQSNVTDDRDKQLAAEMARVESMEDLAAVVSDLEAEYAQAMRSGDEAAIAATQERLNRARNVQTIAGQEMAEAQAAADEQLESDFSFLQTVSETGQWRREDEGEIDTLFGMVRLFDELMYQEAVRYDEEQGGGTDGGEKASEFRQFRDTILEGLRSAGYDDEVWERHNVEKPDGPDWGDKAVGAVGQVFQAADYLFGGFANDGKGALSYGVEILDIPSQGMLNIIAGLSSGDVLKPQEFIRNVWNNEYDKDDDGTLNFRESLGIDPDAGGRWAGALDTIGVIATDPTTYLTFGASGAARQAGRAAISSTLGKAALKTYDDVGMAGLTAAQRQTLEATIRSQVDDVLASGGRVPKAIERKAARDGIEQAQAWAGAQMDDIARGTARRGANIGRTHIPGTQNIRPIEGAKAAVRRVTPGDGVFRNTRDKLTPRAAVRRADFGDDVDSVRVADEIGAAQSAQRAAIDTADADFRIRTQRLNRQAQQETKNRVAGQSSDDLIREALDTGGRSIDEMRQYLDHAGLTKTRELLDVLAEVTGATTQLHMKATDAGYVQELLGIGGQLDLFGGPRIGVRQEYFPHQLTDEAFQYLDEGKLASRLGVSSDTGRNAVHNQARKLYPEMSVDEANRQAVREGLVPEGVDLFRTDVVDTVGQRHQAAVRAASSTDLLARIADDTDMLRLNPSTQGDPVPAGWVTRTTEWGEIAAPKEIIEELEGTLRIINDPAEFSRIAEMFTALNASWASQVTASLPNIGFHARNAFGNWYNNMLAGVRDISHYTRATSVQRKMNRVRAEMSKTGRSFDAVAPGILGDADYQFMKAARTEDIISSSFFSDLGQDIGSFEGRTARAVDATTRLNPLATSGRALGSFVENNARLAHFDAMLKKGMPPRQAAQSVKTYLFDYGDLTEAEKALKNRAARFYTYTRKNLPVQLESLWARPGTVANLGRFEDMLFGENEGGDPLDPWMGEAGMRQMEGDEGLLGGLDFFGGDTGAIGIQSPLDAVSAVTSPITDLGMLGLEGLGVDLPEHLEKDAGDFVRSLTGLTAGVGPGVLELGSELTTDQSAFTGNKLWRENWSTEEKVRHILNPVFPFWQRMDTLVGRATSGEGVLGLGDDQAPRNEAFDWKSTLFREFTGTQTGPTGNAGPEEQEELETMAETLAAGDGLTTRQSVFSYVVEDMGDKTSSEIAEELGTSASSVGKARNELATINLFRSGETAQSIADLMGWDLGVVSRRIEEFERPGSDLWLDYWAGQVEYHGVEVPDLFSN